MPQPFCIRPASRDDVPVVLALIRELAQYEKLEHMVVATPESLAEEQIGRAHV